ncbi:MAG: TIR domain-containing protein [Gammaproteobacteria bacterium]
MTETVGKFRAFISYSHDDKAAAEWLHRVLESYRLPSRLVGMQTPAGDVPARLTPIFRDRDELPAAGDLTTELRTALAQSMFLVVIASPSAAKSRWVNEEIRHFKQVHGDGRVLTLIADGSPGSGDETECFPPALRMRVDASGQISEEPAEPIAADLRPGGDGKRLAKLKLIAGLTGLPLDKLVQREQARRQRRLAALAAVATVIAICMSVLTVMAVRGQTEAERQRAEADGLIEYMLTDLRMQLEPVGRLEIFDSVGKRALAYYANQDMNTLDADALGRRARALHLVGEVRELRADIDGALEAFQQAEKTTAELLARDPGNEQRIFDHSQSAYWVGLVAWLRKESAKAERQFLEYHRLAAQLVSLNPDKEDWRVEQASALINLGVLMQRGGRYEEAIEYFRRALEVDTALALAAPDDREKQWGMAQGHAWLADAMMGNWAFPAAMEQRQKELSIYAAILAVDDRDARAREGRAVALIQTASLHVIAGEYELAKQASRSGLEEIEGLLAEDPDNSLWRDIAVSANNQYVEALMMAGDWEQAREFNRLALDRSAALVASDPTVVAWKTTGQMNARWMEIAVSFALGDTDEAREKIARFNHEFGADSGLPREAARTSWCMVLAMEALDRRAAGDRQAARSRIEELRTLDPDLPREVLVLSYLENSPTTSAWPENRAAQAKLVGYNPALILPFPKGT